MLAEVLEEPLSVGELVRHAATQHRFEQPGGRVVVHLAARDRRTLQRAERLTERTERETSIIELIEDLLRGETAQDSEEGGRIGTGRGRELGRRLGTIGQRVGDPELWTTYSSWVATKPSMSLIKRSLSFISHLASCIASSAAISSASSSSLKRASGCIRV